MTKSWHRRLELNCAALSPNPPSSRAGGVPAVQQRVTFWERRWPCSMNVWVLKTSWSKWSFNCLKSTMLSGWLKPSNKLLLLCILRLLKIDYKSYILSKFLHLVRLVSMLILLTAEDIPCDLNNINMVTDTAYQDVFITNEASSTL